MRKFITLASASVVLLSGCGTAAVDSATNSGHEKATSTLHASRVKDYNSLAELRGDSTAIIRGTAGASTVQKINQIPATTTSVRVSSKLWGSLPAKNISVLQIGQAGMALHDTSQILQHGQEYLLYVKPFHLTPGDNTGRYIITGSQGIFKKDGTGGYTFAGAGEPALPKRIAATEMNKLSRA
ncbi:hypothetical protein [Actinomadura spongiicola]|uniref:hypothetical protein n=1 Tax=Actinomadura spongiicola TaxID=2303421 RepID=UPI0011C13BD8|nr:hypothetical protein [Actinomadura spongiicola]